MRILLGSLFLLLVSIPLLAEQRLASVPLEQLPDDPAAAMVAGMDRFLLRKLDQAAEARGESWQTAAQLEENREFLKARLGLEASRYPAQDGILRNPAAFVEHPEFDAYQIRWPVLAHPAPQTASAPGWFAEAIHLVPHQPAGRLVIIVPDASELPEDWLPLESEASRPRLPAWRTALAGNLALRGVEVVIVQTVSHQLHRHGGATMSRREYLHRAAFELGRTLTGYEVQAVQSLIDHFQPCDWIGICGAGEGGMIAMFAAALDGRIDRVAIGSFLESRDEVWREPLSRQIFGLHSRMDTSHLLALIAPRRCIAFTDRQYELHLPGEGGAPADWRSPDREASLRQLESARELCSRVGLASEFSMEQPNLSAVASMLSGLDEEAFAAQVDLSLSLSPGENWEQQASRRADRLFGSIDAFSQALLEESEYERRDYLNLSHPRFDREDGWNSIDTSTVAGYEKSVERFREEFRNDVIGWFEEEPLPVEARSRPASFDSHQFTSHEVVIDVYPDVFAYGILLMPRNLGDRERRPVVVCQHGLEGRPQDVIAGDHPAYHDFAARLAQLGFIVFAPQNPYIGRDDFRSLQRKAYPLGKTLFSLIGRQHQQIIGWLQSMPNVDPKRIAFYGLSYGGKTAMRVPALLPEYCLSICSADFNDWVWKNASSRSSYSYIGTGEYEIFEFGLGQKFNYAEMAALIAPRPFMVERGHFDGVAPDDRVAKEFAKVRFLYRARLKLQDRCEIEWFDGPHTIHGTGTFEFLQRHLDWPPAQ
jgi:hypothetical protein